ncbi:uncharacterized protein G2W53_036718 [Senna tora]|uniref:Uncharacterized protein n=1 Tax=Senna tora TaxID=362788 RepID=A0A834W528_9FABA|nr:uncharacterized protein G2W53_036718 [Senna tora]
MKQQVLWLSVYVKNQALGYSTTT